MVYLQLFIEFFKTGLFAVGGGLATIPFLICSEPPNSWGLFHWASPAMPRKAMISTIP